MDSTERAQAVRDALAAAAPHLPGQASLAQFIHFISLQGDLGLGFEAAARAAWRRRGARAWPEDAVGRAGLAEGRFRLEDLAIALRERLGDEAERPVGQAGGRAAVLADLWLARLRTDCAPIPTPALRDRLVTLTARQASLWAEILRMLEIPALPEAADPAPEGLPARTRKARHAWVNAQMTALEHGTGAEHSLGDAWRRLTGVDVNAAVNQQMLAWTGPRIDAGVAGWRAMDAAADADPAVEIADRLRRLGVPSDRVADTLERESMAQQGLAGLVAWLERAGARGPGLAGWMAQRLACLEAEIEAFTRPLNLPPHLDAMRVLAERSPDSTSLRLALHAGALPDGLVAAAHAALDGHGGHPDEPAAAVVAHAWWTWREAAGVDAWGRAAREGWPLLALAEALGADADELARLNPTDRARWLALPAAMDAATVGLLWLSAAERAYREDVLHALAAPPPPAVEARAAACFCIDDREESVRRHLEELDPEVQTFSMVGFFGLPIRYRALGAAQTQDLCPVVVSASLEVEEQGRSAAVRPQAGLLSRLRAGFGLQAPPLADTRLVVTSPVPDAALARLVADALLGMGLGRPPALVALLGHGASSVNNPYSASYDCGACAGRHGGPNARLLAALANRPAIRAELSALGLDLSADPAFVAGEHDTTTDQLVWFDLDDLRPDRQAAFTALRRSLDAACARSARERCRRLPGAPWPVDEAGAMRHVGRRALDPSQPRPELGHTGNALAIFGRRALSRGLFLDRRAFLVSYDPADDADGAVLERLLLGAGPVGAQISFDYAFSALDREVLGAGSKAGQNLFGLRGVLQGGEGDLRTGLPWQMVEQHEALRLLLVLDAPVARVLAVYARTPAIRTLVDGAWVQLVVRAPEDGALFHFQPGQGLVPWHPSRGGPPTRPDSFAWIGERTGPLPIARLTGGGAHV